MLDYERFTFEFDMFYVKTLGGFILVKLYQIFYISVILNSFLFITIF